MGKKQQKKLKKEIENFIVSVVNNDDVMSRVFGKYSDGTPRSMYDALNGEFLSPKQKKDIKKANKKKKKKNKKKIDKIFK